MITVIGEALVDVHFDGDLIRPHPLGGPFNTAIAFAGLGLPTTFSLPSQAISSAICCETPSCRRCEPKQP